MIYGAFYPPCELVNKSYAIPGLAKARPSRPGRKKVGGVCEVGGYRMGLMSLAFMFTSLAKVFTGPCRNVHLPSSLSGKKISSAVEGVRRLIAVLVVYGVYDKMRPLTVM